MTNDELKNMIAASDNPLVRNKLDKISRKIAYLTRDQEPLIKDLKEVGINVESVWDLVNNKPLPHLNSNFTGDYRIAYPVLIKHLDYKYHPRTIEGIIRALTEKGAKTIATEKILEMFYKETNKSLKWAMANALKTLMSWKSRQKYPDIEKTYRGL
jgi:hypothetical protein